MSDRNRIRYMDALRGLSMILVVLAHVFLSMSDRHWDGSPVAAILMSFRMPLFFFVSGFFAYKAVDRWTKSVTTDIIIRKLRAQILCATIFYMLYQYVHQADVFFFIGNGYGYFWFTIALFQMFLFYVLLNLLSRLFHINLVDIGLIAGILVSCFTGIVPITGDVGVTLSWHQVLVYFQFFAAGIFTKRYWSYFEQILETDWFRTVMIVLFVAGCFYFYGGWYHQPRTEMTYLTQGVLHRYTGLFSVLIFFHHRKSFFDGEGMTARFLRFTGRRTLDIYMMHMFFMPILFNFEWVKALAPANLAVLKLGVAVPIAMGIVGLCLLCSSLLRSSHFLAVWLFGVRRKPRPAVLTA